MASHAQLHACAEIERIKVPAFETMIMQRAAYVEVGLSGLAPHFMDRRRTTVAKAVDELDQLVAEIDALIQPASRMRRKGAA
ncbi:MAG: hypothetical protein EBS23_02780 [Betaproteobacteria bacterium]|nr:hypothetical protein [Betaproteobacteria bacterium]